MSSATKCEPNMAMFSVDRYAFVLLCTLFERELKKTTAKGCVYLLPSVFFCSAHFNEVNDLLILSVWYFPSLYCILCVRYGVIHTWDSTHFDWNCSSNFECDWFLNALDRSNRVWSLTHSKLNRMINFFPFRTIYMTHKFAM